MSDEIVQQVKERIRSDQAFFMALLIAPLHALQDYPLSEEEKLQFVLPNFRWMMENQLAGSSYPYSEDALALLKSQGIEILLNLAQEPLSPDLLEKYSLHSEHLPLADFTAPGIPDIEQAMVIIDKALEARQPIVVHCGAGLGRTGTILACSVVKHGHLAADAIQQVRAKQPGAIETAEQEAVIGLYEQHLKRNISIDQI